MTKLKLWKPAVVLLLALASHSAIANDTSKPLSMSVYNQLTDIERIMAQQEYREAQERLDSMLKNLPQSATDQAYLYHTQGTLYLSQERYREAEEYFLKSHELNALNDKTTSAVVETLANLAMHFGDYRKAVMYLQEHLGFAETPTKQVHLTLGTAYYQLKEYRNAIRVLKNAMSGFEPDRSVHLLLFSSYYELNQLSNAAAILERVITLWPEETQYWLQLASIYLEQKRTDKSLEILQLAYTQGVLFKERELLQYVHALYEKGLPYKAAVVLSDAMARSQVTTNYKSTALLAGLYVDAREDEAALEAFQTASDYAADGKESLYIAQIYFDKESYRQAIKYTHDALDKGIKRPGRAYLLLASAHQKLGETGEVEANLQRASKYKESRQTALEWLQGLESETIYIRH
jgi:tetratricopeptide (TPR) repeat protein